MVANWVQIFVVVLTGFAFLLCLIVSVVTIYAGLYWHEYKSKDDTRKRLIHIQNDLKKIKYRLNIPDGDIKTV